MTTPEQTPINIDQNTESWKYRTVELALDDVVAAEIRDMEIALGEASEVRDDAEFSIPRNFDLKKGTRFVKDNRHFKKRAEKSIRHEKSHERETFLSRQAIAEEFTVELA